MLEAAAAPAVRPVKQEDVPTVRCPAHHPDLLGDQPANVIAQLVEIVVVSRVDDDLVGRRVVLERHDLELGTDLDRRVDECVVICRREPTWAHRIEAGRDRPSGWHIYGQRDLA